MKNLKFIGIQPSFIQLNSNDLNRLFGFVQKLKIFENSKSLKLELNLN